MDAGRMEKQLLASSYAISLKRIRVALQGKSPSSSGEVVGLCGQGGKHPYFKIPVDVLDAALARIERGVMLAQGLATVDAAMEEIAGACQELRQQTSFDDGTGCVNDRMPSMVPLLPPEEIWLDRLQLPMDIWRLVCFEFDLVASSVSSQVAVEDFAFSAVNQSALAFRFLMNKLGGRRVRFEVELNRVPAGWIPAGTNPSVKDVSLARIFFEGGSLLTPLADEDFIKGYGAVRYLHWIDGGSPELRVKDEFDQDKVDCRYRGLFAEETAIGLMATILRDVFGAEPINNTVEVAPPHTLDSGQPVADFVAQATNPTTSQQTTIIAESKGSLGKAVSPSRHSHAKDQLEQTEKVFVSNSTQIMLLAFGSTIRFSRQRVTSRCVVTDPPVEIGPDAIEIDPVQSWRVAYAKTLKFVGLENAAQQVLRGAPAEAIRPIDFDRQRDRRRSDRDRQRLRRADVAQRRFAMALILDVGQYALGLDTRVLAVLQRGINAESTGTLSEVLNNRRGLAQRRFRGDSFEASLGFGCLSYSDLDVDGRREDTQEI